MTLGGLVRAAACISVWVGSLMSPTGGYADRIGVWKPFDAEAERRFYARVGREFPEDLLRRRDQEAQERLKRFSELLAPVEFQVDKYGTRYFEGRILKLIPPSNSAAPWNVPERYATILFEAYGKDGSPKSAKPALLSAQALRFSSHIDTKFDLVRIFSNRHELLGVPFGSKPHRAALFSALDPDGSLGLSSSARAPAPTGVQEGALVQFAAEGALSQKDAMGLGQLDPISPMFLFREDWKRGGSRTIQMPFTFIEEIARARRYPGFEPEFLSMAVESFRILYTLGIATPALASSSNRDRATRLHIIGTSAVRALATSLDYHSSREGNRDYRNRDRPLMPLSTDDLRETVLTILEGGPIPPVEQESHEPALGRALFVAMEKGKAIGGRSAKLLERFAVPIPGEDRSLTELHEPDRAAYRKFLQDKAIEKNVAASRLLARVGWGPPEESRRVVDRLLGQALVATRRDGRERSSRLAAVETLRVVADSVARAREDRRIPAQAAAQYLAQKVSEIRAATQRGSGATADAEFFKLWDASPAN